MTMKSGKVYSLVVPARSFTGLAAPVAHAREVGEMIGDVIALATETVCGSPIGDTWRTLPGEATAVDQYASVTCGRCRRIVAMENAEAIDGGVAEFQRFAERFWSKVDRRGPDDCWPWMGATGNKGYGVFRVRIARVKGMIHPASRVAYQLEHRKTLPSDVFVCHRCDNPPCCNPAHLFEGSVSDNEHDKMAKGRNRKAVGERAPTAKLTAEQVREIRSEWDAGRASQSELARRYGLTSGSVNLIVRRKTWTHV